MSAKRKNEMLHIRIYEYIPNKINSTQRINYNVDYMYIDGTNYETIQTCCMYVIYWNIVERIEGLAPQSHGVEH